MKTGLRAVEKGREALAETMEKVEDMVAETRAEMRAEREDTTADFEDGASVEAAEHSADESNVRSIVNE